MPKIKVLEKSIAELIAAGEVVERPASVVKELVENSIDAGANIITVEIKNGGVRSISITDNGCGIVREDVKTAFLRHATSKVNKATDLDSIATLGFRGEALASICAVAKVKIITKTEDELIGTEYRIKGSEDGEIKDIGCSKGTTIIVEDLFYNTPARMKFLKKDVSEGGAVASVVDRLALSHPEVSFKFIKDGKEVLNTPGNGDIKSCIYSVYGREFTEGLIPVNYAIDNVSVKGFICAPTKARPNRSMQHFFINSRYVKSRTAVVALEQAFKDSIKTGKYPSCVLYIDVLFEFVDINVHPAKIEVRFINEKPVFDVIYYGVKTALMNDKKNIEFKLSSDNHIPQKISIDTREPDLKISEEQKKLESLNSIFEKSYKQYTLGTNNTAKDTKTTDNKKSEEEPEISAPAKKSYTQLELNDSNKDDDNFAYLTGDKTISYFGTEFYESAEEEDKITEGSSDDINVLASQTDEDNLDINLIGEAFRTYMILERKDELILIDKHAAHERLIYEEIKKKGLKHYSQYLLEPLKATLDKEEYVNLLQNKQVLEDVGIEIDDFGEGSVLIRSAPMTLEINDIVDAVMEISGYITLNKTDLSTAKMDWIYHSIACKSAIKAGDKNKNDELIKLALDLEKDKRIKYCPHGRPVSIVIKKQELEKQFKRT